MNKKVRPPKPKAGLEKRANGQGSIYFDTSKYRYIVAVVDINDSTKRHRRSFLSKKEAEAFRAEYVRNKGTGIATFAANPKMKVGDFLCEWHRTCRGEPETRRSYSTAINNWISPYLGNLKVSELTPGIIEGLYRTLDNQGFSNSVLHIAHVVLNQAFKDAVRHGTLSYNPMNSVKKMHKSSIPTPHIPSEDARRIYSEAAKDPYLHARIELGMIKGLRPGEVRGLHWSDINWTLGTITIQNQYQRVKGQGMVLKGLKTHDTRVLPLSKAQMTILQMHQLTQEAAKAVWVKDLNLIFPNGDGLPKDEKADRRDWIRLLARAGVTSKYTLYQMRKTAITNLITNGVDEKTASVIAGHSSPAVTMKHYANATTTSMIGALAVEDAVRPVTDEQIDDLLDRASQDEPLGA